MFALRAEHPRVREAVVPAREDTPGDRRLVAYVVGEERSPGSGRSCREWSGWGAGDDFFMQGGHSILGVQMISRVRQVMEVEPALAAVLEKPVLSALADRILDLRLARFDPETLARLVREPGAKAA